MNRLQPESQRLIILTEDGEGGMTMETAGYTGGACLEEAAKIAAMLGETQEGSIELKPEFNQRPTERSQSIANRGQIRA